jgi:hypothetical protein
MKSSSQGPRIPFHILIDHRSKKNIFADHRRDRFAGSGGTGRRLSATRIARFLHLASRLWLQLSEQKAFFWRQKRDAGGNRDNLVTSRSGPEAPVAAVGRWALLGAIE